MLGVSKLSLKHYATGQTSRSQRASAQLRQIGKGLEADLKIIDVLENPQMAEDDAIPATPTLIKASPIPIRQFIGDLSDDQKVLLGLDLLDPCGGSDDDVYGSPPPRIR